MTLTPEMVEWIDAGDESAITPLYASSDGMFYGARLTPMLVKVPGSPQQIWRAEFSVGHPVSDVEHFVAEEFYEETPIAIAKIHAMVKLIMLVDKAHDLHTFGGDD